MMTLSYPESVLGRQDVTSIGVLVDKNHDPWSRPTGWASKALLAGILFAGTGGAIPASAKAGAGPVADLTSTTSVVECLLGRPESDEELFATTEKLAFIQDQFSLNLTALATVLRISRPTLYSWLREESEPHPDNLSRIDQLQGLAFLWRRYSSAPAGRLARRRLSNGSSILDLLSREVIDEGSLRTVFSKVASMVELLEQPLGGPPSLTARVRQKYGMPESTPEERDRSLSDNAGI